MKKGAKSIRMVLILCAAFLAPRVFMNGGADFIALKDRFLGGVSGKEQPAEKPATGTAGEVATVEKPPVVITPDSIAHKDAIDIPLPEELKRSKAVPLAELIRFDYVPNDIVSRWPYVTAVNPELHMQAYRVPFFTGTAPEDLEGVITYYFDTQCTQQIAIRAKTGDFRPVADWMKTYYGFEYRETQSPVVYVYEQPQRRFRTNGSHLWIRPNHAFAEGYDYKRFDVTLVLNRPKE